MTEYDNLKSRYISTIQLGLAMGVNSNEVKNGNEILHKFCEDLIDNSDYTDADKKAMKYDLKITKEALSKEIESFYQKNPF